MNLHLKEIIQVLKTPAQLHFFRHVLETVNVQDKRVLDVGCDRQLALARSFILSGASIAFGSNIQEITLKTMPDKLAFVKGDFTEMDVPLNYFDVVTSRATLEHFPTNENLRKVLIKTHKCLVKGGKGFFSGGPMWTSKNGHHVWLKKQQQNINYTFTDNNPLLPWEHLIYTKNQLKNRLIERSYTKEISSLIIDNVYNYPYITSNRIIPSVIIQEFEMLSEYFDIEVQRSRDTVAKHEIEFFKKALSTNKYSKEELLTYNLNITITKK